MRNIEIKAKVQDIQSLKSKARELSSSDGTIEVQLDTFFNVPNGRLKLREFQDKTAVLVFYKRPDMPGPKLSTYNKAILNEQSSGEIKEILSSSNGVLGKVLKTRHLYLVGQTRIHIDEVEELGHFMELEVVLKDDQDIQTGENIAEKLMKDLNIQEKDLISEAYFDLLLKKHIRVQPSTCFL